MKYHDKNINVIMRANFSIQNTVDCINHSDKKNTKVSNNSNLP